MSSKVTKVRFVRCPKCWKVLLEPADVPVYICGGCNATLKAKNHIKDCERTNSEPLSDNPVLKNELDHDLEIKSFNNPSSGETCKLDTESEDCNKQHCENKRFRDEVSSSGETNFHEKEELSSEAEGDGKVLENDNGGCSNTESQSPDTQVVSRESSPVHTARRPYGTEMLAHRCNSFLNEQSETSSNNVSQRHKCTVPRDTMRRTEHPANYNITSDDDMDKVKFRGRLKDVSKSPTTRNSHALASDNSKRFHQASNFKRLERDEFLRKDHEHFGHLNHRHKDFPSSSSLYATKKPEQFSCDQMELLQKVDELRDQLYRSCALQRRANETILDRHAQLEKQWLFHHNLQHYNTRAWQPSGEFRPRKAMTHCCNCRETAFSETGTNWHDYNEDWKCLQKKEPPEIFHEGGLRKARPVHMCYNNPYSSVLSSPLQQENLSSCFQEFDTEVKKVHNKERHKVLKRYYHPIAGGAPFIICYRCFKLLHIPGDFLQTSKKCHRLRCGSCSKVLTFSIHKRAHTVPCSPNLVAPPPSIVDNNHAYDTAQGDPVSYSGDYGHSTCKSCSTENEPGLLSPQTVIVEKMQPSSSYINLREDKKKRSILSHLREKHRKCIDC